MQIEAAGRAAQGVLPALGDRPGEQSGGSDSFPGSGDSTGCSPLLPNHRFSAPVPSGRAPAKLRAGHDPIATDGPEHEEPRARALPAGTQLCGAEKTTSGLGPPKTAPLGAGGRAGAAPSATGKGTRSISKSERNPAVCLSTGALLALPGRGGEPGPCCEAGGSRGG